MARPLSLPESIDRIDVVLMCSDLGGLWFEPVHGAMRTDGEVNHPGFSGGYHHKECWAYSSRLASRSCRRAYCGLRIVFAV